MNDLVNLTKSLDLLYVEDDASSREEIKDIFAMFFKSVTTAADGVEALEYFKKSSYDLVVTDINMPRMDGIELTQEIRKIDRFQKILMLSAHNSADFLLKSIELNVDGFILKPLSMQQFVDSLTRTATDIHASKALKNYQEELEKEVLLKTQEIMHSVVTDKLTGLNNRFAFMRALDDTESDKNLILINIDNFDNINVGYGYNIGNEVLKQIGLLFQEQCNQKQMPFYIGSDEFSFLLEEKNLEQLKIFAEKVKESIAFLQIRSENININITATVAISQDSADTVLQNAYIALKESRTKSKNLVGIYAPNSSIELFQKKIKTNTPIILKAIRENKVVPYFQAIRDNNTQKISRYEALARIDIDGQHFSPASFIDVAEKIGVIAEITKIMIDKTFQTFSNETCSFSINITEYDLNEEYLREYLRKKLQEYSIEASRVVLEILEGVSAVGTEHSIKQLNDLKDDGFLIAIDDFGAENSNFERVHRLRVDFIKIDGSFIKDINENKKSFNIAKTIAEFSKSIGAKTIAEFVHSKEVQQTVEKLGIEYSQGYYYSEPNQELLK